MHAIKIKNKDKLSIKQRYIERDADKEDKQTQRKGHEDRQIDRERNEDRDKRSKEITFEKETRQHTIKLLS